MPRINSKPDPDNFDHFYDDNLIWAEVGYDTEYRISGKVMYIRGTDSMVDFAMNLVLKKGNDKNTLFHHGFYLKAQAILESLDLDTILNLNVIKGHSAGGAIAGIVGYTLALPSVGYNCPKFLRKNSNVKVPRYFTEDCRIFNQVWDIVGHLPFHMEHPEHVFLDDYFSLNPFAVHSKKYRL